MQAYKIVFLSFLWLSATSFAPVNQDFVFAKKSIVYATDQQQIETLIRKTYEWVETKNSNDDFNAIVNKKGDKYIGLDTKAHAKRMEELKKTNFFSQEFLDNYNKIALKIGDNLKTNKMEYFVGDLPPYGNDANFWCDCQDGPENYWKTISINITKIETTKASLNWAWKGKTKYKIRVVKETGTWKIAYMEGFDYNSLTSLQ